MENNREFRGVWLPKEIWLAEDLGAIDKIILAEIDSLDNENHFTTAYELAILTDYALKNETFLNNDIITAFKFFHTVIIPKVCHIK